MDAREAILGSLDCHAEPAHESQGAEVRHFYVHSGFPLLDQFRDSFQSLFGKLMTIDEARAACPRPAWVDDDVTGAWGDGRDTDDMWAAAAGVTSTLCAVAQTGSILLSSGQGMRRMASLAPPVHIALVDRIVPTLADALALLPSETSVLVSGPSRTADIEGVMVRGVHGPGELWVVLMEGLRVDDASFGG